MRLFESDFSMKLNSRNKSSNHKLKSIMKIKLILLKNNKHVKINFTFLKSSLTLKTKDIPSVKEQKRKQ